MNFPKTIVTETNDILEIIRYENGKFIIGNSPTIVSYAIEVNQFQTIGSNGIEVPYGLKAKNHEIYLDWLSNNK
jgi:hypothetical protein